MHDIPGTFARGWVESICRNNGPSVDWECHVCSHGGSDNGIPIEEQEYRGNRSHGQKDEMTGNGRPSHKLGCEVEAAAQTLEEIVEND